MGKLTNVKQEEVADVLSDTVTLIASGAIPNVSGTVNLTNNTGVIAATFANLKLGSEFLIRSTIGTQAHTVTLPAGYTWDGTNNRVTLDSASDFVLARVVSANRLQVIASATVAFSAI